MNIKFSFEYTLELEKCNIDFLIGVFKQLLPDLLRGFIQATLEQFGEHFMAQNKKPFECECGNDKDFIWKTRNAKTTSITTIFANLILPQMQVQCKTCGKKMFVTRELLGIEKYQSMSSITQKMLALVGALTTFRVSEKITGMFGATFNRMKIWRCVQKTGKEISFDLEPKELPVGEADGTGIAVRGIRKRGQELKVFIQRKIHGGARIAGLSIGRYDAGWEELFAPVKDAIKSFNKFLLITDGDSSIFKGMKCMNVILQRCLWHIPHQLKHCLWSDKVKRKSVDWMKIMGKIFNITSIRQHLEEGEIEAVLEEKRFLLSELISFCKMRGYTSCASYLVNASQDMFTAMEKRMNGKSSSLVERVMKTVNMRVNVGKWTPSGALNAMKLRLAHYYNDWIPCEPETKGVKIVNKKITISVNTTL